MKDCNITSKKKILAIMSVIAGYYCSYIFGTLKNEEQHENKAANYAIDASQVNAVLTSDTLHILNLIEQHGYKAKIFGGAVRDCIFRLSLDDSDIDIATTMPAKKVTNVFKEIAKIERVYRHRIKWKYNGKCYDIITINKRKNSCAGSVPIKSFEEFAKTRDFTMNAIYMNKDGKLEDYVGGIDDILNGKIRFNGDPLERITGNFCRIFRYFRFITVYGGYDYNQEYISIINTFIKNKCYTKAGRKPYILKEMLKTFRKSDSHRAIPEMRFLLEKIFDLDLNHNPLEICFQLGFSDMSPIERVCMLFKFSKIPMKDFVKEYNISAFSEPMAKLLLLADAIDIEDAKNNLGNIPKECRNFHIKYTLLKMYIAGTPESKIKKLAAEIKL